ncbi:hypothetical protein GUITHDRAFT_120192 [Guillardia theta CCMP2712]|uniref:Uncharacterized protein n=1 Tax=Guillardia theta (strain CCMP2712) TaxID=905079 RepID=L1IBJ1_GUITC|nr:hypothetical protein GUITHDRAFT_120192 [Guillardia theta CCMP2712]EKX33603.1 hypothetical protein GUITHDRAFT_120192 [Guillardia theta CCMP2712]|eukprot:XP_005820583.1 hypothetical protein GUITHDRAFT_120192 [Guillardia theta CCMP2712]
MLNFMMKQGQIPTTVVVIDIGVWLNHASGIFRVLQPVKNKESTLNLVRDRGLCRDWTFAARLGGDSEEPKQFRCSGVENELLRPKPTNPVLIVGSSEASLELSRIFMNSRISSRHRPDIPFGSKHSHAEQDDVKVLVVIVTYSCQKDSVNYENQSLYQQVALLRSARKELSCFVLLLDGVELSRAASSSMAGCVFMRRSSPIRYSVSLDADIPSQQDISKLVENVGIIVWPAGDRTRVPMAKCYLRLKFKVPTPDRNYSFPSHYHQRTKICLCVPTITPPGVSKVSALPFINTFLPSLVASISDDFSFENYIFVVYVAYDQGDPLYDKNRSLIEQHTKDQTFNRPIFLKFYRMPPSKVISSCFSETYDTTQGGIAFLWNSLMAAAWQDGCDYFYQSNDDVQFVTRAWAKTFVETLQTSLVRANFGVVGAVDLNNNLVLTQSFVHRTHQHIFSSHFPMTIKNWHLDDWISQVYPENATFRLKNVFIKNTNMYAECREDKTWYENEVLRGRRLIQDWMKMAENDDEKGKKFRSAA